MARHGAIIATPSEHTVEFNAPETSTDLAAEHIGGKTNEGGSHSDPIKDRGNPMNSDTVTESSGNASEGGSHSDPFW